MRTEDLLIETCDRLGMGVDINFLRGTVTVNTQTGRGGVRKFNSLEAALRFVQDFEARIRNF